MMWPPLARYVAPAVALTPCLLLAVVVDANTLWSDDCEGTFNPKSTFQTTDSVCVTGDIDYVPPGHIFPLADIYIVANREWQLGDHFVDHYGDPTRIEATLPAGSFFSEVVQLPPLQPGEYDLVLDEYADGVYTSADVVVGVGTDFAFLVESDVLLDDDFETGTCFRWTTAKPVCGTPHVGLRIELTWATPADPDPGDALGTDLDLHVLHPDASGGWLTQYDCHADNPTPDWGVAGPHEDAAVILVDDDGGGPEVVQITDPESVDYDLGVYYVDDLDFGPSDATLNVWIDGTLTYQYPGKMLFDGEFWHLGSVEWPGGTVTVVDSVTPGIP